jgi:hypothetical protein
MHAPIVCPAPCLVICIGALKSEESFRREAAILGLTRHPNVVELVGYASDPATSSLWLM